MAVVLLYYSLHLLCINNTVDDARFKLLVVLERVENESYKQSILTMAMTMEDVSRKTRGWLSGEITPKKEKEKGGRRGFCWYAVCGIESTMYNRIIVGTRVRGREEEEVQSA